MLPSERTSYDKNKVHSHPVLRVSSAGEERKLKNRKIHSRKYSREIVKRRQALSGKGTCVNIGLPRIGRLGVGKSNSKGHDTRAIDHPANAMGFPDGDCRRFDSSSVHWPGKETGRHIDWDFASRFPLARQQSGGCTPRESSSRPRVAVPRSPQIGFTNRREVGGVWGCRVQTNWPVRPHPTLSRGDVGPVDRRSVAGEGERARRCRFCHRLDSSINARSVGSVVSDADDAQGPTCRPPSGTTAPFGVPCRRGASVRPSVG